MTIKLVEALRDNRISISLNALTPSGEFEPEIVIESGSVKLPPGLNVSKVVRQDGRNRTIKDLLLDIKYKKTLPMFEENGL